MTEVDSDWISTDIVLKNGFEFSDCIVYSPSKRYAMIQIQRESDVIQIHKLMILDLHKNTSRQLQMKEWTNLCYWYWLDEATISVFNEDIIGRHYSHYVYSVDVNDPESKLELINTNRIPHSVGERPRVDRITHSVNKLILNNQDYLLVRTEAGILCPYDITARGPLLPPLKIKTDVMEQFDDICHLSIGFSFVYKNLIYLCVRGQPDDYADFQWMMRAFIKIEAQKNDLVERKTIMKSIGNMIQWLGEKVNLNKLRKDVFIPKKLNEGLYVNYFQDGSILWQDGPIVLITSMNPEGDRLIWILNMEKETIMEHKIDIKFYCATIYRGFLHLWTTIPNDSEENQETEKIVSKFIFLRCSVPKLSDICTIRLMSQNK